MRELQRKQKLKHKIYSTPVLILLTCLVLLVGRSTYLIFQKSGLSGNHVSALEQKVKDLEDKERLLTQNIGSLETEAGIEKEVKEKFNVSKEGERVVILVDQHESTTTDMVVNLPWYKAYWNAIIQFITR